MTTKKLSLLLAAGNILAAFLFSPPAKAVTADITDISNRAYEENVLQQLDGAKEKIYVAMFSMYLHYGETGNPAAKLVDGLIDAHNRGVYVRVYLDRYSQEVNNDVSNGNDEAYQILQNAGIDTYFIQPQTKLHTKLIVIDEEIVIDGSTNWTQMALQKNQESDQIIRSKEYAKIKMAQINELEKIIAQQPPVKKELQEKVSIRNSFLEDPRFGAAMVTDFDQRAFDFYLLLLKWFKQDGKAARRIDYVYTAKQLGVKVETVSSDYRRQVRQLAQKLKDTYHLADYSIDPKGNLDLILLDTDTGSPYTVPQTNDFGLPLAYWEYGLDKELSTKAKFAYLLSLREQELANPRLWWSISNPQMQKKYHIFASTISAGLMELKRKGFIDIINSLVNRKDPQRYVTREPNQYRLKELISPQEKAKLWKQLEEELGAQDFKQAKEFAAMLEEDHDIQAVRDFARITKEFGAAKVRQATEEVSQKAKDNPYRSIALIISILR